MEVLNASDGLPGASGFELVDVSGEGMEISSQYEEHRVEEPESVTVSSEEDNTSTSEEARPLEIVTDAVPNSEMETDEIPMEQDNMTEVEESGVAEAMEETNEAFSPPMETSPATADETRFDLEFVENHMRHFGSNAGPHYATDTPIVLGRDIFKKHDKHRMRGLISRTHCRIESSLNEKGDIDYYVKDLSVNGTFLGPNRISPTGPGALVQHGDVIGLLTSHSGPIETYSAEGTYFKVTLGLRFLRPNLPEAKQLSTMNMEHHAPIASPMGAIYKPGTFAGLPPSVTITVPHEIGIEHHRGSLIIVSDESASSSANPSPVPHSKPYASATRTNPHTPGARSSAKKSKGKPRSSTNHSGNDTDDTDGDDERDAVLQPTPVRARKAIVTVSKPTFDSEGTPSAPAPRSRKASTETKERPRSNMQSTPLSPGKLKRAKKARSVASTPSRSATSTPEILAPAIAPGTYWNVSTDSTRRKRSRSLKNGDSGDDLASEEPARKLWAPTALETDSTV